MGNKFEVESWELIYGQKGGSIQDYHWVLYYGGENKNDAMASLEALKEKGHSCVRLVWR